ncbi:hypothetical protein BJAS_P4003 [Bathymodiolus japonicus methanotrophic gill symbiont]|uniref:plasmid mobilization protein n=1 Tax=Bathymodiolus japonicus methanotrophic gill symbiont TaxID=113269 RepID=UPI001B7AA9FC|nr:plasmid mobilization relaxosome protein MobC [Bathymodiolus japonicus methanotrophic gill symbiont]GFO73286.1 hypothetical protein BJAS_P4003 [Bathymodiolus japonicus methanotrophic gill symbiont]
MLDSDGNPVLNDNGKTIPIIEPKRTEVIHVRLFPDEKVLLDEKVKNSGRSVSELIRLSLDKVKTLSLKNIEDEREKIRQIVRIGKNLNQISHWCNAYTDEISAIELFMQLKAIENELNPLISNPLLPSLLLKT